MIPQELSSKTESITKEEIEYIVQIGSTIPTGDNCQPFHFEYEEGKLKILHQKKRAWHVFNNQEHASILSFGCLLKAMDMAASVCHLEMEKTYFDPLRHDKWCELKFSRSKRVPYKHAKLIPFRCTDRRPFSTQAFENSLKETLKQISLKHEKVNFSIIETIPEYLMDYLMESEGYMWKTRKGFEDVFKWIRFNQKEIDETSDGMPVYGLGLNAVDSFFMRILKRFPFLVKLLWKVALRGKITSSAKNLLNSSSGLFLLSVESKYLKNLVRTGECAQEIWMELTSKGYGVQPWTLAALNVYDVAILEDIELMPKEFQTIYKKGLSVLRKSFNLSDDQIPVWLFRAGKNNALPAQWRTKRIAIEDILKIK